MSSRPNLLLFMPDQLRADCVGALGNPIVQTPNIDALAARGTRFSNAFAQHSVCSPSRASFLTGWYPHVHGHRTLDHLLQSWEPNALRMLRQAGYHVAWAGLRGDTFAAGVTEESTDRWGFTERPADMFHASPYPPEHRFARTFYHGVREPALDFDEACIRTAETWLAEGLPEPWVLFVPLMFPHPPFTVEEPWFSLHARADMEAPAPALFDDEPRFMREIRERYGTARLDADDWAEIRATYYGMISRVDAQLGRVLQAIERAGCESRTATFFFTDHGEYLGDYGLIEKWPSGLHDCLLRNPLIVSTPNGRQGQACDGLVELVDLLPSFAELVETVPAHTHFGRSLVPILHDGASSTRDAAFSEGGFALEEEPLLETSGFPYDLKSELQHDEPACVGRAIAMRSADWTYVRRLYEGDELYDRSADPRELVNLIDSPEHAQLAASMREQVLDWLIATSDVIPNQKDARFERSLWKRGSGTGRPLPEE